MSTPITDPDDPRLTAYALGETSASERDAVERFLAESAEARTAVEQTRALARSLEAEFARENAAYQQEHPATVLPANVVGFPNPRRRWRQVVASGWKLAAMFVALGTALFFTSRRTPPPVATVQPAAPRTAAVHLPTPEESASQPTVVQDKPETNDKPLVASAPEPSDQMMNMDAQTYGGGADRAAEAPPRREMAARSAPGAARPAPPAAAPAAVTAPSLDRRLAAATVRIRLDDGTYVGGVVLSADGWILAAKKLSAIRNPDHATVILADGREYVTSAVVNMQNIRPGLFRIKAASLPTVALASQMPTEGSQLVVAHVAEHAGEVTFQRSTAKQADELGDADFVFDADGGLLTTDEAAHPGEFAARAKSAIRRDEAAVLSVRPFTARERASLARPTE